MSDELPDDTASFESLTVAQAEQLAQQEGDLTLDGLVVISDDVAEVLAQHVGGELSLNGLKTLSDRAAAALARHEDYVFLEALTRLTNPALAAKLAPHTCFKNLVELSVDAVRAIAATEDPCCELQNFQSLSAELAAELSCVKGYLGFDGLRELSLDTAVLLAKSESYLRLGGLATIAEDVARALAQHKGGLDLPGLTSLSDRVARELGQHCDHLHLDGCTFLSATAAGALAVHKGLISLNGLGSLSAAAAKAFAPHDEMLSIDGMASIADDTARELAKHRGGLSLGGLTVLTDAALQSLSQFRGWVLKLDGLTSLSPKQATMLARYRADYPFVGGLGLDGLTTISAAVAAALARFKGRLFLGGITELSDVAAAHLATHEGLLSLYSLAALSNVAAEALGTMKEINVSESCWCESAAASFRESRERTAAQHEQKVARPGKPLLDDQGSLVADETSIRSTLVLRDLIAAAPTALAPVGQYTVMLSGDDALSREEFLRDSEIPRKLRSDVQFAVGDYLATLPVLDAPNFACGKFGPDDPDATRVNFTMPGCPATVFFDAVSPEALQQLYAAAAPAAFGDMKTMETRVDPLVRSGREISVDKFTVPPRLCEWVRRTWARGFQPESVRIEPYKINLYAPGDRFVMHRDTPEKDLVGTFLLALSGWGPPCSGGGLVVHDEVGTFRWDGASGWAAFLPYMPHEVEPITTGARVTLAFKVFATSDAKDNGQTPFDEALLEEAANRIALCRNSRGQVGVLLKYSYSLNGTALCGSDRFIYRALERLGVVESVPVAVQVKAEAVDEDTWKWRATANVYELSPMNLAKIAGHTDRSSVTNTKDTKLIPFIAASGGHVIYHAGNEPIENTGNYAEPANVDTLYVHRALIVRKPLDPVAAPVRCAAADLRKVDLSGRDLQVADLQSANLAGASLARANLQRSFLANADLSNANLRNSDLSGADLACADLTNAQLSGACLHDASLQEACLEGVKWDATTLWPDGFDSSKCGAPPMHDKPPKKDRRKENGDDDDERRAWCG